MSIIFQILVMVLFTVQVTRYWWMHWNSNHRNQCPKKNFILSQTEPFDLIQLVNFSTSMQYYFMADLKSYCKSDFVEYQWGLMLTWIIFAHNPHLIQLQLQWQCMFDFGRAYNSDGSLLAFHLLYLSLVMDNPTTVSCDSDRCGAWYSGIGNFNETAGTYSYTVTDANNCSATTTISHLFSRTINPLSISVTTEIFFAMVVLRLVMGSFTAGTPPYSSTGSQNF